MRRWLRGETEAPEVELDQALRPIVPMQDVVSGLGPAALLVVPAHIPLTKWRQPYVKLSKGPKRTSARQPNLRPLDLLLNQPRPARQGQI